jgi:hypothetical protein
MLARSELRESCLDRTRGHRSRRCCSWFETPAGERRYDHSLEDDSHSFRFQPNSPKGAVAMSGSTRPDGLRKYDSIVPVGCEGNGAVPAVIFAGRADGETPALLFAAA